MFEKYSQPIVGSGFLASKFKKYKKIIKKNNVIIYAAGISNSLETNKVNLKREINKIRNFLKKNKKKLIYISTYSINDNSRKNKPYVKNKIKIENLIKKQSREYLIIRLPEIIGKNKNSNTLTNFFFKNISSKKSFVLYKNVKRNILDVDDALRNCMKIIYINKKKNKIVNLLNKNFYTPLNVVNIFEKFLHIKANFKIKSINQNFVYLKSNCYINSDKKYLPRIIKKYYFK